MLLINWVIHVTGWLLSALGLYLLYERFIKMCYLRWLYGNRGVAFMSTIPIPFIGDLLDFVNRITKEPDRPHMQYMLREAFG